MHKVQWGPHGTRVRTSAANWRKPLAWNAAHQAFFAQHGRRQRVFCASLADVFDNAVDPQWRADLFALIEATPNLDWLLLTKRIGNVRSMVPLPWISKPFQHGPNPANIYPGGWPANVWLGTSIVNQEEANRDIPKLLEVPARVRFLSMEPLLGPVDLRLETRGAGLHQVIAGGESGPGARHMHPAWPRSLRDQCAAAGVPFHFKQWGEWAPQENFADHIPSSTSTLDGGMWRVGKKVAGRLLDGVQHDGYPITE